MPGFQAYIRVCHKCDNRKRPCAGACHCLSDGRDIIDHARAGDCPLGHYENAVDLPEPPPSLGGAMPSVPMIQIVGPALWAAMHTETHANPAFVAAMLHQLPCGSCKADATAYIAENPPVYGPGWFEWTVDFHNFVNRKLSKSEMTLADARDRFPLP